MVSNENDCYINSLIIYDTAHTQLHFIFFLRLFNLIGKHILLQKVNGNAYFCD